MSGSSRSDVNAIGSPSRTRSASRAIAPRSAVDSVNERTPSSNHGRSRPSSAAAPRNQRIVGRLTDLAETVMVGDDVKPWLRYGIKDDHKQG
jgi:hypothetical protein